MPDRSAEKYAREFGDEALARQKAERGVRLPCCGEMEKNGHHMMCSQRPADQPVAEIDGQESLL